MAKKVFIVAFALLLVYSIGSTAYIVSARREFKSQLDDSIRTSKALNAELERARSVIDTTSLRLERAIGRVEKMQDRDSRIRELIGAIKGAIGELIGYIAEVQGEAPDN